MRIKILPRAEKQIVKLPDFIRVVVAKKIRDLGEGFLVTQIKKLKGQQNFYRVRVGSYRIVYYQSGKLIEIIAVRHRKDIYR